MVFQKSLKFLFTLFMERATFFVPLNMLRDSKRLSVKMDFRFSFSPKFSSNFHSLSFHTRWMQFILTLDTKSQMSQSWRAFVLLWKSFLHSSFLCELLFFGWFYIHSSWFPFFLRKGMRNKKNEKSKNSTYHSPEG